MNRQLRDIYARVVRAHEALQDGESELAKQLLDDLADDVWRLIEREERLG